MPDYMRLYLLLFKEIQDILFSLPTDNLASKMLRDILRRCGELERGCENPAVIWDDTSRQALQRLTEHTVPQDERPSADS